MLQEWLRLRTPTSSVLLAFLACPALATEPICEVPFDVAGRVILVKASVAGSAPMTFIVDTGATETILTPTAARRLGINWTSAGGDQGKALVKSVSVSNAVVNDLTVYILDPPQALPLRLDTGVDYAGLIGYTFLSRFVTTIDYGVSRIRFARASSARPARAFGTNDVPFEIRGQMIHIAGKVNGRGPVTFMLDTGSAEVLLRPEVANRLGLKAIPLPHYPGIGMVNLQTVTLGNFSANNIHAIVQERGVSPLTGGTYDGILGYPFLSQFSLTLDYANRFLSLTPTTRKPTQRQH